MTGLRYSPLHVTEFCGEMQGEFKVGFARLIIIIIIIIIIRLDTWLDKLGITIRTGLLQKTASLGTARILRKVLER